MRFVLTLIAVALVALLTAALTVPYLVDWSAHRAEIAERLEAVAGGRVTLSGPVTLRLLPTPFIEVGAGSAAGASPDAPSLTFEGARLELALAKLASGVFRFTDVRLEKPVLTLSRAADGALILPASSSPPAAGVGFDRFAVQDGTVRIVTKAGVLEATIEGVQLEGDAATLAGPYRVSGRASGPDGTPIVFRLASESPGPAGAPVRVTIEKGPRGSTLEFDGTLAAGARGPSALGAALLTGTAPGPDGPAPWRAAGKLAADLDGATLANADFRFGPEERALRAGGNASLAWRGPARLTIDVKAKQANVDALLRRDGEDGVPPARVAAWLADALSPALAGMGPASLEANFAVETAILGGDTLAGLAAGLAEKPGEPLKIRFDLGLPGRSRLEGEGELEPGLAARFAGGIDFSTEDAPLLARWAGLGAPEFGAWTAALGDAPNLSVSGGVEVSRVGFSAKKLKIALGRSLATGSLAFTRPVGADPGRIYADLAADSLDVDALPSFGAAGALAGGYDLSLSLEATALSVAHAGESGVGGASLRLKLARTGPAWILERLAVAGLGGAVIEATGALGPDGGTASGRLSADRLAEFAALVSRLAPGPWSRALVQRAPLLSPASLAFEATSGPLAEGAPALRTLKIAGEVGRAAAALTVAPAAKRDGQAVALVLDSPDSGALLRQLGLAGAPNGAAGPGHVDLRASGGWTPGFDVEATAALAGATVKARGRCAPAAEGDDPRLFGSFKLTGDNVAPLASVLGLAPPGGAIGPLDASADITLRGDRWTLSRVEATVAGVKASGALGYQPPAEAVEPLGGPDVSRAADAVNGSGTNPSAPPPSAALTGELSLDRLPLADLLGLTLGPPQPASAGGRWPEAKFRRPPLTLPAAAVRLKIGAVSLFDGLGAQGFSAALRLDGGRLDLDDIAMRLAGGAVSGRATLRRSGEIATLDGVLSVEPLLVKRPGFSGRVGGRIDFASTGKSPAALIGGLAGGERPNFPERLWRAAIRTRSTRSSPRRRRRAR